MGYPWPTPQEREAKRLQSEAAAIASGIRNADDVDTTYQGGLSDSLRAIKNIPQASEYTKRSGVTWNPNVATTQQIQEENPGWLSRAGTAYTNVMRPFVAPVYYGALKAREKFTGDDTGTKELERFFALRKAKAKDDLSRSILGYFHPLDKEDSDVLAEAWNKNPLPWGVLGSMEIVVDPINILPVGYIAKATGTLGIGAFKSGTRLLLGKGNRLGMVDGPVTLEQASSDVAKKIQGEGVDFQDYFSQGKQSHTDTVVSADNGYTAEGQKQLLDNNSRGKPPDVAKTNIGGAMPAETVVNNQDRLANLHATHGHATSRLADEVNTRYAPLLKESAKSFDINPSTGGVRNVVLNETKATEVLTALKSQLKKVKKNTKEFTTLTYAVRQLQRLIDTQAIEPHYSTVIEHADVFNLTADQTKFFTQWREMQDNMIRYSNKVDAPDQQLLTQTYNIDLPYSDILLPVGTAKGYLFPHMAKEFIDPVTGQIKKLDGYDTHLERVLRDTIEQGIKSGYRYDIDMAQAAIDWAQSLAKHSTDAILLREIVELAAERTPGAIASTARSLLEAAGKTVPDNIEELIRITPTAQFGDALEQTGKMLEQQVDDFAKAEALIDVFRGLVELSDEGVITAINSVKAINKTTLRKIKTSATNHKKNVVEPRIKKLKDFRLRVATMQKVTAVKKGIDLISQATKTAKPQREATWTLHEKPTARFLDDLRKGRIDEELIPKAEQKELARLADVKTLVKGYNYGGVLPSEHKMLAPYRMAMKRVYDRLYGMPDNGPGQLNKLLAKLTAIETFQALGKMPDPEAVLKTAIATIKAGHQPFKNLDTLARKYLDGETVKGLNRQELEYVTSQMATHKGELQRQLHEITNAVQDRIDDAKLIRPIRVQLEDKTILQFDGRLREAIVNAPETKDLPGFISLPLNINRTFRLFGTAFDASQPVIQGLRLLTVPGGYKVWGNMYAGSIRDILAGKIDGFAWYNNQIANVAADEWDSMMRANVQFQQIPEFFEVIDTKYFKSVGEVANKVLDKVPGDMSTRGSMRWMLDQVARRPNAAMKAYAALSNASRVAMYRALLPQVRDSVAKKIGYKKFTDINLDNLDEVLGKIRPFDESINDLDGARAFLQKRLLQEEVALGEFVNKATGVVNSMATGGISKLVQDHQVAASFLLFAPRFFASQISLTADIFRFGTRGRLARESTARLIGAGLMFYTATAAMLGSEPKLDPRPKKDGGDGGDFLSLEINGTKVSIGGSGTALIKFLSQQYMSLRKGTLAIEPGLPDPENNSYFRFLTNRLSPIAGTALEVAKGRTYGGHPVDFGDTPFSVTAQSARLLGPNLLPFWLQSLHDSPGTRGWGTRLAGLGAEFVGFNTYASSPWNVVQELQDQYADSDFGDAFEEMYGRRPTWDDMDDSQQAQIEMNHDDLRQAEASARELWGDRAFTSMQEDINLYMGEMEEINTKYHQQYKELVNNIHQFIQQGDPNFRVPGAYFRNNRAAMFKQRAEERDALQAKYPEVIEYFNEPKDQDKFIPIFNLVKQQYLDNIVFAADLDVPSMPGGFDFNERDRRVQEFIEIFGEDMYVTIRQQVEMVNTSEHPMEREYRWGRDLTKKYWNAPNLIMERLGYTGLMPMWSQYSTLKASPNPEDRAIAKSIKDASPQIQEVDRLVTKVREEIRKQDPLLERYLYKYGYVESLVNAENAQLNREAPDLNGGLGMAPLDIPYPEWKFKAIRAAQLDNEQQM